MAQLLAVDPGVGLAQAAAAERLEQSGPNEVSEGSRRPALRVLIAQLRGVLVWILVVAAVLSLAFGQVAEAVAVMVVLALNVSIGFVTELRAVRSVEALRGLGAPSAVVRRGGVVAKVPARDLVPGDVVLLEAGDVVAADARVIAGESLSVDEAALTGESLPVDKSAAPVAPSAVLADRTSMVYRGTAVLGGSGEAIVVATGRTTEVGRLAELVATVGPESTPLERRLDQLGGRLLGVAVAAGGAVAGYMVWRGEDLYAMVQTGIALAVATVPESLPVIATLTLARGARRMAARNALVNRLSAVETLGATGIILTDKTGTLTQNRMAVSSWWLPDRVEQEALRPSDAPGVASGRTLADRALRAALLCRTANTDADGEGVGDPMELALLQSGADIGVDPLELARRLPTVGLRPFDPAARLMATAHRRDGRDLILVKGGPGPVVAASTHVATADGRRPLEPEEREAWLVRNRSLAGRGLRVLALAEREGAVEEGGPVDGLTLLGLVGLSDPPRHQAAAALESCRRAGVGVVMVTGDQPATAIAIARRVGLARPGEALVALTGAEVAAALGTEGGEDIVGRATVLARVDPEQKLRLVELHRRRDKVVAMIGDGVNDAPALRSADIGVAMGLRGTDVAREAADMVLKDDDFATVVAAIEEGRAIFRNVRAAVSYLLSCNLSEIAVIGAAALMGLPLPLLPLQILFLNLVTDVFPAIALGATRASKAVLDAPPRPAREPILDTSRWRSVAWYGAALTIPTLAAYVLGTRLLGLTGDQARTVAFLGLAAAQVLHVLNMREPRRRGTSSDAARDPVLVNPWVWAAILACGAMIALVVLVPPLSSALALAPLPLVGWYAVAVVALAPLAVIQAGNALGRGQVG